MNHPTTTHAPSEQPPQEAALLSPSVLSSPEREVPEGSPPYGGSPGPQRSVSPPGESPTRAAPARSKRKGGRKPIYATTEERKQRNRQAQAAFRERRTEYIKQLETTIKHNEQALQSLQANHRAVSDECLMLRYKNSLLERLLLEKGIDVQSELQSKPGPIDDLSKPTYGISIGRASSQSATVSEPPAGLPSRSSIGQCPLPHLGPQDGKRAEAFTTTSIPFSSGSRHIRDGTIGSDVQSDVMASQPALHSPFPTPESTTSHIRRRSQSSLPSGPQQLRTHSAAVHSIPKFDSATLAGPFCFPTQLAGLGFQVDQNKREYPADGNAIQPGETAPSAHENGAAEQSCKPELAPHGLDPTTLHDDSTQPLGPTSGNFSASGPNGPNTGNALFDPYDHILDVDPFGLTSSMHFNTAFSYGAR